MASVAVAVATFAGYPAVPADPCAGLGGMGIVLCRFVPFAPDLDGDLDVTTQFPPADGGVQSEDIVPGSSVCAAGCV